MKTGENWGQTPVFGREEGETKRSALLPGLVNAHTHAAMSLLRNAGGGLALDAWLRQRIWPLEARLVDEQFVADGTELAIAEMLLGGITCFGDMYYYPDVAARVAARSGMRTTIGMPVLEQPGAWAQDVDEYLRRGLELRDQYRDDPLDATMFVLHSPSATSDATLLRVRTLADQLQVPVMTHLLESPNDRDRERRLEQTRYEAPGEWGKLLGLDRLPEVKTLREKIGLLCAQDGRAAQWQSRLAQEWMEGVGGEDPESLGLFYVDGHVRVYHGKLGPLPRLYVARQKLCLRGTTDYWVNGLGGAPFFVVTQHDCPVKIRRRLVSMR